MLPASGNFCYRKSTVGKVIAAMEVNNGSYCLQQRVEKLIQWKYILLKLQLLCYFF